MSIARIFGVVKGAGVSVREVEAQQSISPADIGWAAIGGILDRGVPGKAYFCSTLREFQRVCGGRIAASDLPLIAEHFYKAARGAGGLVVCRVTDGHEVKSTLKLYQRKATLRELGTLTASSGGVWGGPERRHVGTVSNVGADITATTLDTGEAMQPNEWAGASLELVGVANKAYKVISNDASGVLTVEASEDMAADLAGGLDPTNDQYYIEIGNADRHLAAEIGNGESNPSAHWSLTIYVDGERALYYPDLSSDPESPRFWEDVINNDLSNELIVADNTWEGPYNPSTRPANHYAQFSALTDTTLAAKIFDYEVVSDGNPTVALGTTTEDMIPQTITLTMTAATTFAASSDVFGALGSGSLGVQFTTANKWIPPFTATAGDIAMDASDVITMHYKPLVGDLAGGRVKPDPASTKSYRIVSNTHSTITTAPGSTMETDVTVVAGVHASGEIQFVAKADFVDGESFTLNDGFTPEVTFWIDQSGGYTPVGGYDATNIRLDLSAATTAEECAQVAVTAIDAMPKMFQISTDGTDGSGLLSLLHDAPTAVGNVAIEETVVNAGFTIAGMSGGVTPSADEFMVMYQRQFTGGVDGNNVVDADYVAQLWSLDNSPFKRIRGRNLGLVKCATPGVTSATVQKAGIQYAVANSYIYRVEAPASHVQESVVDAWLSQTLTRSIDTQYAVISWPSFGYITNPNAPKKLKLISLTGMILGIEAADAAKWEDFQKAPAGITYRLPDLVKLPTEDRDLDNEFLTSRGINFIRLRNGQHILWGDRTLQVDADAWTFYHHRAIFSHTENELLEGTDWVIFAINDRSSWNDIKGALRNFFVPKWQRRVFRGAKFDDAVSIKIDSENNTQATMANGDLYVDIELQPADTVERMIIRVGKKSVETLVA